MRSCLTILLLLSIQLGYASTADSLLQQLLSAKGGEQVSLATELYREVRTLDSAVFERIDASVSAIQFNAETREEIALLQRLGRAQWLSRHGHRDRAIDSALVLVNTLKGTGYDALHGRCLFFLSYMYSDAGKPDRSIQFGMEARTLAAKVNDTIQEIECLNMVGEQYRALNAYERAIEFYEQGIALATAQRDTAYLARLFNNKGIALTQLERFEPAEQVLLQGLEMAEVDGIAYSEAILLTNLGFNAKNAERFEQALEYYTRSLKIKEQFGRTGSIAYTLNDIGETYFFLGKYEEAIAYSKRGLKLAVEADEIYYQRDMSLTLSNTYAKTGQYDSAYRYLQRYQSIQSDILNDSTVFELARIEQEQALREKQLENELLQQLNEESERALTGQRYVNGLMIALTVVLMLFGFVLWRSGKLRERYLNELEATNAQLDAKNQQLNHLLNEQEALFNIVTHDLKGPLVNAKRLLEIEESADRDEQKKLRKMLKRSVQRSMDFILEFNTLHAIEKGEEERNVESIDILHMLEEVLKDFQSLIEEKKLSVHVGKKESLKIMATPSYLQHILQNLVSNAVKYSPDKGSIFITVTQTENTRISIENQGLGIQPDEVDRVFERFYRGTSSTETHQSSGLGLALVKLLVDRMRGSIKLKSTPGERTEFIVTLPNR